MNSNPSVTIGGQAIGIDHPTYFIADIAANHDGDKNRAIELIHLAAEAGADVAKFQHFEARSIVSDFGFKNLKSGMSHQESWSKSVFEVYEEASVDTSWTSDLAAACKDAGIGFFTSPYSPKIVDEVDPFVSAFKIGSGDITWHEMIRAVARKRKPYILAAGASTMDEVREAVRVGLEINPELALLQCNTNYTASLENFRHIQLRVLNAFSEEFPSLVLGLSDHTPGHSTVLGAVALGARIIEKHFTDDTSRSGPDHKFAMDSRTWREMVDRTRELELALGGETKRVEENERETVVVQRRATRVRRALEAGHVLVDEDLEFLRPCPAGSVEPYMASTIIGRVIKSSLPAGAEIQWTNLV